MLPTNLMKRSKIEKLLMAFVTILFIPIIILWLVLKSTIGSLYECLKEILLGLDKLPIHFYWFIKYQSIEELIKVRAETENEEEIEIED